MDTATVFISSKMQELAAERTALYDLLTQMSSGPLKIKPWAYERDAPASNNSIRDVYLKILEESALYIGLFWQKYGEWTIDEYRRATEWHIDRLLFVKADAEANRDTALNEFLQCVAPVDKGLAPVWFTDVDDLAKKVENSLRVWINEKLTYRPGSANAVLVTDPDDVPHQPRKLIGREDLLAQLNTALSQNSRVLLQGFGGMGKTALAATAAAEYLKSNPGPMLWQEIGKESSGAIFEALARPFNAVQQIAKEHGDAKIQAMRALLRQTGVKLLVLDNAWDGPALKTVLEAMPRDVPVIVTSRHAYPLDMRIEVDELSPTSAVETLAFYAGNPVLINDPAATELCDLLGYLAFALEIAGKQLMVDKLTPAQLTTRVASAPHKMGLPRDFAETGRRSVGDLLETSLDALDNVARRVFMTFGVFFAPQITLKMLMHYLVRRPNIVGLLLEAGTIIPLTTEFTDTAHYVVLVDKLDPFYFEAILNNLIERGLLTRIDATDDSLLAYRIQDMTYSFLAAQVDDANRASALDACLAYTESHHAPSLANFAALAPELDNLMGAAAWADATGYHPIVEQLAWDLWVNSGFLDYRGHYRQAITLLQSAVHAAESQGNLRNQGASLGHLGNAYVLLGEFQKGIDVQSECLALMRQINDQPGAGTALGDLGTAYFTLGDYRQAIACHTQALAIAHQIEDKQIEGNQLGSLGNAYYRLADYPRAIDYYQQALAVARQIGDLRGAGNALGSLGSVYLDQEDYRRAIDFYQQALAVARQIGDLRGEANRLGNLGKAYFARTDYHNAVDFYHQALTLARQMGDQDRERLHLEELGRVYALLADHTSVIEVLQSALPIIRQTGDKYSEGRLLDSIGTAYSTLGRFSDALNTYHQALTVARQTGDKFNEGISLGNIGNSWTQMGDYQHALEHYEQARAIFAALGIHDLLVQTDRNIATVQAALHHQTSATHPRKRGLFRR